MFGETRARNKTEPKSKLVSLLTQFTQVRIKLSDFGLMNNKSAVVATMVMTMTAMSLRRRMMMKSFMMLMIDSSGCVCDNDAKRVDFSTMDTVSK